MKMKRSGLGSNCPVRTERYRNSIAPNTYTRCGSGKCEAVHIHIERHERRGSGVVVGTGVGKSRVVTAWHTLKTRCRNRSRCVSITVVHKDQHHSAHLVERSTQNDLALLNVDAVLPSIGMASRPVLLGHRVYTAALPDGDDFQSSEGIVVGVEPCGTIFHCIRTNAVIERGASEGALLDANGELVGHSVLYCELSDGRSLCRPRFQSPTTSDRGRWKVALTHGHATAERRLPPPALLGTTLVKQRSPPVERNQPPTCLNPQRHLVVPDVPHADGVRCGEKGTNPACTRQGE